MTTFLYKILFGNIPPISEYATVTVPNAIAEKVWLESGTQRMDVSGRQWLLCLQPIVFGIWLRGEDRYFSNESKEAFTLRFMDADKNGHEVATAALVCINKIKEENGLLLLLRLTTTVIQHVNIIKERLLYHRHYKKPAQNLQQLKAFATAYSYPRKVRLISFKEGDYCNIFPMDLVGDISTEGKFVFGLRHSNESLSRILRTKKIAVAEIPYQYKQVVYQLGKHHQQPISTGPLPFDLLETASWHFPLPVWICNYREIDITGSMNLGSHMLLLGNIIHTEQVSGGECEQLFHIHFLHYLHQAKNNRPYYPLV